MKGLQFNNQETEEVFDIRAIARWQDVFSKVSGVYTCLLGENGEALTELSGSAVETAELTGAVTEKRIADIRRRVIESDIEDQAVEITSIPNLRLCAVAMKEGLKKPLTWILYAVLTDSTEDESMYSRPPITQFSRQITEEQLYRAMDLLRDTMNILPAFERQNGGESAGSVDSSAQNELSRLFLRAKTMTEIVSLLDSQDNIDTTMEMLIRHVGEYIDLSHAFICQTHRKDDRIDIVTQWSCEGERRMFDHLNDISRFWFLKDQKTLILHHDSQMSFGEREHLDDLGIKSLIVMPIEVSGRIGFYACFTENRRERHWDIDEIKFISDTIKILHSIIARRVQKNSLASSFQSLEAILDNVGSSIYVRDMNTDAILFANRSLKSRFSREMDANKLGALFERDIPPNVLSGNYEIYDEDRERWYDLYYTHIVWVDGRPVALFAIYDVTDKKLYQKRIEQQAYTDFLTGMYNRMCCERDLVKYIDEATKAGTPGALLYLDLDDFKHINDGLGHQYGDLLLKTISHSLRSVDGISNTCYRMGGDEFVIIVSPKSYPVFEEILDTIKGMFARPWYLKDTDYYCTMSMGIVEFPKEGDSVTELIKKADIAMYEAKKAGKNRVAKYTDNIDSTSFRRLDMEKNMRDATING
ncbi:MAG: GGDEF domain-containing protein, partial [Lachnospiraceae bacterium]|nr:GGDEF domain-containing protein [Lachnospiraceae bacterium]